MPGRKDIFQNGKIYHIFNKTIDNRKIFENPKNARIFLDTIQYYRSSKITTSFSTFNRLSQKDRQYLFEDILNPERFYVDILAFCLMPTHYHLLIKQKRDKGIKIFVGNIANSFTRYFNIKFHRKGPLFLPRFQSRFILTEGALLHVSRYIHLNPYSSGMILNIENLVDYPWSSFGTYIISSNKYQINIDEILESFRDKNEYKQFVYNQADYQKSLEEIKYINKWL